MTEQVPSKPLSQYLVPPAAVNSKAIAFLLKRLRTAIFIAYVFLAGLSLYENDAGPVFRHL